MSASRISALLSAHLGLTTHAAGLVATRSFRSITVTLLRPQDKPWRWRPTPATSRRSAVVLFPADGRPVPIDGTGAANQPPLGLFLPAEADHLLAWEAGTEVLAVWVPEHLLQEFVEGDLPEPAALFSSPLTIGFRTFAHAVMRHGEEGSSMSQYAVERLLAEMTFGSLLEQQSAETSQRPSSLVERARSVMLMHREDPDFSTPQLATELHISPRQLQRAFARAGVRPGEMLRRMRVELAESMLRNPLYSGLSVEEVARYAGFTSALQLRRALQAEGTPSPSRLRQQDAADQK